MMNKKKILTLVLLPLVIFAGCKKDKDGDSPNNYIKYEGKTYTINQGILENYGEEDEGVYNLDLTLFSSGINLIVSEGEIVGATGKGNVIYFEMFTTSETQLDAGTYEFDYYSEEAGTFDDGEILINYDAEDYQADIDQYINHGTVTVAKSGDIYEIRINCTDEDDKSVTGYFKGTLTWYDASKKKSTNTDKRRF
jgi:hypothetical protein